MTDREETAVYDVAIVGAGPGGLSAALLLGRARRSVALIDAGPRRNAAAEHVYGFVTRDGVTPDEFRASAREQLRRYETVTTHDARVERIARDGAHFVLTAGALVVRARKVLLASGLIDTPPALPGVERYWGRGVILCPFCHGFEVRDRPFGVLLKDAQHLRWAPMLRCWTGSVTAFTNGAFALSEEDRSFAASAGLAIDERPIAGLAGEGGALEALRFGDGSSVACAALFVRATQTQLPFVSALGLELDEQGFVRADPMGKTAVEGVFVAGDLATPMQSAMMAAASGARAAAMLTHELAAELFVRPRETPPVSGRAGAERA